MGRTLSCVSVTVNMLLRITYDTSLAADDSLTLQSEAVSRLLSGSAESCQCDSQGKLVFACVKDLQTG